MLMLDFSCWRNSVVEYLIGNEEVESSILSASTKEEVIRAAWDYDKRIFKGKYQEINTF